MKAEKMFVGSLAIVISLLASGCAETTLSAGRPVELGAATPVIAAGPGQSAAWTPPATITPLADRPTHGTNRAATMSLRAVTTHTR
jgi:hypothetical protein